MSSIKGSLPNKVDLVYLLGEAEDSRYVDIEASFFIPGNTFFLSYYSCLLGLLGEE